MPLQHQLAQYRWPETGVGIDFDGECSRTVDHLPGEVFPERTIVSEAELSIRTEIVVVVLRQDQAVDRRIHLPKHAQSLGHRRTFRVSAIARHIDDRPAGQMTSG